MYTKPNVIVIIADTLRADHLGCYGYNRSTSPEIDAFTEEGVLSERFFCSAIPTCPSFTTLYTGQHPIVHGIVAHGGKAQLDKEAPFLSQIFLEAGYTTCAIDNLNRSRQWFARGYEYFIDPSIRNSLLLGISCEELNNRAISWLKNHANETFFLFIHYWDPHWPLTPPARYQGLFYNGKNPTDTNNHSLDPWWDSPFGVLARDTWLKTKNGVITDPEYIIALYDREIRHLNDGVANLLSTLDSLNLKDNTIVIFSADHGESMTEHGIYFDHHGLYDCTIHVPFIMRWPLYIPKRKRISQMLQHQDIAPTLLEAVGISIPSAMTGKSFWKLLTGEQDDGGHEYIISVECTRQAKWSLRTDNYKFILAREQDFYGNPPRELYDLKSDPKEEHNLVQEQPDIAAAMEKKLENWIAEQLRSIGKSVDPLIEQGVSLGHDGIGYGI